MSRGGRAKQLEQTGSGIGRGSGVLCLACTSSTRLDAACGRRCLPPVSQVGAGSAARASPVATIARLRSLPRGLPAAVLTRVCSHPSLWSQQTARGGRAMRMRIAKAVATGAARPRRAARPAGMGVQRVTRLALARAAAPVGAGAGAGAETGATSGMQTRRKAMT